MRFRSVALQQRQPANWSILIAISRASIDSLLPIFNNTYSTKWVVGVVFNLESIDLGKNVFKQAAEKEEPEREGRQERLEDHEHVDIRDSLEVQEKVWEQDDTTDEYSD